MKNPELKARVKTAIENGRQKVRAEKAALPPKKRGPIPYEKWPKRFQMLASFRADGDVGVGDTVERCLGTIGKTFKATMRLMGFNCGCDERKEEWNRVYQYPDPVGTKN